MKITGYRVRNYIARYILVHARIAMGSMAERFLQFKDKTIIFTRNPIQSTQPTSLQTGPRLLASSGWRDMQVHILV